MTDLSGSQAGDARARLRDAVIVHGDDELLPVAATTVVLRDGAAGPEVLMVQRPARGSFAGAWVFPGGMVEPDDHRPGATEADAIVEAAVREAQEEVGLVISPDALVPISCWVPPVGIPKRARTWFFLTPAPDGALALQPDEVVQAQWVRPFDALELHARGELMLVPPTFVTLWRLQSARTVADAVQVTDIDLYRTRLRVGEGIFRWQGDEEYDEQHPGVAGQRHRVDTRALPWVYETPVS